MPTGALQGRQNVQAVPLGIDRHLAKASQPGGRQMHCCLLKLFS
jgi:hypothetical protein